MMKTPLLLIILLSSPQNVVSFARHSRQRPTAASPAAAATGPSKVEQASSSSSSSSVAYSFRQSDDDNAIHSEESKLPILSSGDEDDPTTATNGSNANDGISIEKDEIIMDIVGSGTLGDIMSGTPDAASAQGAATSSLQFTPITTSNSNNNINNPSSSSSSSSSSQVIDGLVTKEGGELNTRFNCNFTPMERIALTSNGNLQRIFSSYYDAPVHVHIDFCERRSSSLNDINTNYGHDGSVIDEINNNNNNNASDNDAAIWDRIVHIHVHGQTICKATSIISVKDPVCVRLIEDGTVGLGQLFRYLNRLPTFSLMDAGRRSGSNSMATNNPFSSSFNIDNDAVLGDSGIWRTYELKCEEMTCLIHEEFREDAWNISPLDSNGGDDGPFQPMI